MNFNQISQQWNLHIDGLCNIFVLGEWAMGCPSHNGFFHLFHSMTFGNDSNFTMHVQKLIAISNFGLWFLCCYICILHKMKQKLFTYIVTNNVDCMIWSILAKFRCISKESNFESGYLCKTRPCRKWLVKMQYIIHFLCKTEKIFMQKMISHIRQLSD